MGLNVKMSNFKISENYVKIGIAEAKKNDDTKNGFSKVDSFVTVNKDTITKEEEERKKDIATIEQRLQEIREELESNPSAFERLLLSVEYKELNKKLQELKTNEEKRAEIEAKIAQLEEELKNEKNPFEKNRIKFNIAKLKDSLQELKINEGKRANIESKIAQLEEELKNAKNPLTKLKIMQELDTLNELLKRC